LLRRGRSPISRPRWSPRHEPKQRRRLELADKSLPRGAGL